MNSLSKPPEPLPPIDFSIPRPELLTLENGLVVHYCKTKRVPAVNLHLTFNFGELDDPPELFGLSSAMAAMMSEGTENFSSREIAEKIERLGADLSIRATTDFFIISARSLSIYFNDLLDLLEEVIFRPTFPEDELDLYKRNTIEHLKFQRSQPSFLATERALSALYGNHPLGRYSPTAEEIMRIDRSKLSEWHKKKLLETDASLLVVGDIEKQELISALNDRFASWQRDSGGQSQAPLLPAEPQRTLYLVDRPASSQANIIIANRSANRTSQDYFAILVMNQILGAGASSRVFMNLREEKGYTYGAYTRFDMKRTSGEFEATTEVRNEVVGAALSELDFELSRIRTEQVKPEELADAKAYLKGVFPIRAETQEGLTGLIANKIIYGLPDEWLYNYRQLVDRVSLEDVTAAAQKYIKPENAAIVVVGDGEVIFQQVSGFAANLIAFDQNGQEISLEKFQQQEPENFAGKWQLSAEFQGQTVPISLSLNQTGSSVTGALETALGSGVISTATVNGCRIRANASATLAGQQIEFTISGELQGEDFVGQIVSEMFPQSLGFKGRRETDS
jgi:predicted Zn-dependent peptidase